MNTVLCRSIATTTILTAFCCLATVTVGARYSSKTGQPESVDSTLVVAAVDSTSIEKTVSLQNSKGEVTVYHLTAFTQIIVNDKPATLDKILVGMTADITIGGSPKTLTKIIITGTAKSSDKTIPVIYMNRRRYDNVRFGAVLDNGSVQLIHDGGISVVAIADLPPKCQKLLHFTPPPKPDIEKPEAEKPIGQAKTRQESFERTGSTAVVDAVDRSSADTTVSIESGRGIITVYQVTSRTKIYVNDQPATLDQVEDGMKAKFKVAKDGTLSKLTLTGEGCRIENENIYLPYHDEKINVVRWGDVDKTGTKVMAVLPEGNRQLTISDLPLRYQKLFSSHQRAKSATEKPVANIPAVRPTPETKIQDANVAPNLNPTPKPSFQPYRPAPNPVTRPTTAVTQSDRDWEQYSIDRKTKVLFQGKLADVAAFKQIVGFIAGPGGADQDGIHVNGTLLELAEPNNQTSQPTNAMSLRPNLWKRTGKMVLLRDYKAIDEVDMIVRLTVVAAAMAGAYPLYEVATEPTLEQWQKLRSRLPSTSPTP